MNEFSTRRQFLQHVAGYGAVALGLPWIENARAAADDKLSKELPKVPDHALTVISGKPRERGRRYGHVAIHRETRGPAGPWGYPSQ